MIKIGSRLILIFMVLFLAAGMAFFTGCDKGGEAAERVRYSALSSV
jgi:hypothetical protein